MFKIQTEPHTWFRFSRSLQIENERRAANERLQIEQRKLAEQQEATTEILTGEPTLMRVKRIIETVEAVGATCNAAPQPRNTDHS